jgi:kynurenine formamidase
VINFFCRLITYMNNCAIKETALIRNVWCVPARLALATALILGNSGTQAQISRDTAGISPWGSADEIGALNMMTDTSRLKVLRRTSSGKVYDLGVDLFVGMPLCCSAWDDPSYQIWMTHVPGRGQTHGVSHSADALSMYTHTGTHIDSLSHFSLNGQIWNQVKADDALDVRGWKKSGAEKYPAILARGVMIDLAKAKNLERLPPSYAITAADLQDALSKQRTVLQPGDVVLLRTGLMTLWPDPSKFRLIDQPGLSVEAARWLVDDQKAMLIGADNFGVEAFPSSNPGNMAPVHSYLLVEKGVSLLELVWLEDLAKDGVYEFLFMGSPLKLRGASASPLRPIAIPVGPN